MAVATHETVGRLAVMESQLADLRKALSEHEEQDRSDFAKVNDKLTAIQVSIAEQKPWMSLVAHFVSAAVTVGLGYVLGRVFSE